MNVVVEYLYRDAGNNKVWGEALFSNKYGLERIHILSKIKNKLIDGEFFVAEKAGIDSLHFERYDQELDHGWHEFFDVKPSDNQFGAHGKDIAEFIGAL